MTPAIKLSGNLGDRHRCLNTLVHNAFLQNTPLPIQTHLEESPIDRIFKIDLALKQKNVDYIIDTLKQDDMLYVSRALKNVWLLDPEHENIINPNFLENELFPQMTMPASNKLRHWIHLHLRDPQRCREFYQFYKDRNFNIAAKFLRHCSREFILGEVSSIFVMITPKLLKILSEQIPQITKIYYDNLKHDQKVLKYYIENESEFIGNIKYLLKSDANVFFYVLENFYKKEFGTLNADVSKYILKNHKNRVLSKPELYSTWFLDIKTVARYLSSEEIKDLVLKLARADFLTSWFSYQNVEHLIKRLSEVERTAFKKMVFVDKAFGPILKDWPYSIPTVPELNIPQTSLFEDQGTTTDIYCDGYTLLCADDVSLKCAFIKKRKCKKRPICQSLLDQLFDKYRFSNYKHTYKELQKQLRAESSPKNRQYMLLVLVSKTGGRTEDLVSLLDLLSHYKNEPVHIRAAIVRSLVKRAFVWRLPSDLWAKLLEWSHGLGLDGSAPESECREGLHAVVIRDLLANIKSSQAVWEKFLTDFDTLKEYSFTVDERNRIKSQLPASLLADALFDQEKPKLSQLQHLLNTLDAYHIRYDNFPGTIDAIALAVKCYWNADDDDLRRETDWLLRKLYDTGVARRRLIKEFFEINQTDYSYVNALRHSTSILDNTENFEKLVKGNDLKHEKFFRKLALYFMEKDGLGERYRAVLEKGANYARSSSSEVSSRTRRRSCLSDSSEDESKPPGYQILAKYLAFLSGSTFVSLLEYFDSAPAKTPKKQFAAALRANMHLVRPAIDVKSFGWHKAGAKAVANIVGTCRKTDVEEYLRETLSWRRTLRLALVLAKRVNKERDVFKEFVSKRPGAALQAALRYFRREGDKSDLSIWEMVKARISEANSRQLYEYAESDAETMPAVIKAEYCFLVYLACKQKERDMEWEALTKIPALLHDLPEQYIYDMNDVFLKDYFTKEGKDVVYKRECAFLVSEIIAKFLVLSTTEEMIEKRLMIIALPFLSRLEQSWKLALSRDSPDRYFDTFLFHLRYNKAFFNDKYVSCLPVIERVTEWMHGFLPIEKWFDKYVAVHLTMLYFKTVRHCIKQKPELFSNEAEKLEGARMLGIVFAKFVSNELEELKHKYFPTITEVYASDLVDYFDEYFCRSFDDSVKNFTMAFLNELLANKTVSSSLMAKCIFNRFRNQFENEYQVEILKKFKESDFVELRFATAMDDDIE